MNYRTSLLSLLTIPSLLLFTPHITIASTIPKTEVVDPQTNQLAQAPDYQAYKSNLLAEISRKLAEKKEFEQALQVLTKTQKDEIYTPMLQRTILLEAAGSGEFDIALQIANSIEDENTRNSTLVDVASFLADAGKAEQALQVLQSLPKNEQREVELLWEITRSFAAQGKTERALEIAQSLENGQSQAVGLANAGAVEEALQIAETLGELDKTETLGFIAMTLGETGNFDQALKLAKSLPKSSFQGNTLLQITKSLVKREQWEQALEVAQLIKDDYRKENAATAVPSRTTMYGNRSLAFIEIAMALTEAGKLEQALQAAQFIEGSWEVEIADVFSGIAVKFVKLGKFDKALELARNTAREHDDSQIGIELARVGKLTEARQIALSLEGDYLKTEVFSEITLQLINSGKIDEAIQIAQSLKLEEDQGLIFGHIAKLLAQEGKIEAAWQIVQLAPASEHNSVKGSIAEGLVVRDFKEAINILQSLEDDRGKYWIARNMAVALVVDGKVDQALQLAESLEIPYYSSSTALLLGKIGVNFAKLGDFDQALEINQSIHESFRWQTSGEIAIELAAVGEVEQSLSLAESSFANSWENYPDWLLFSIASELAEKGQVEAAIALGKKTKYTSSQTAILGGIAVGLGAKGEFDRGLEMAASLEDDEVKADVMGKIALQLIEVKKFNQGMEVARSLNKSVNEFKYRGHNLKNIASAFTVAKQFDFALEVAEMLNSQFEGLDINGIFSLQNLVLREIAISQAKAGNTDEALKISESVLRFDKVLIISEVAVALAKSGDTNRALELASSLGQPQQSWIVCDIATTLVEKGKIDKGLQLIKSLTDPSSTTIAKFAIKLAEVGEIDLALEFAQSVADSNKDLILAYVAAAFVEQGDFAKAKEIRQSIDDKQIFALERTITELAEQGKLTTAKQLSQLLPNNLAKAGVLNKLATYHIEAGEKEQATKLLNEALSIIKNI